MHTRYPHVKYRHLRAPPTSYRHQQLSGGGSGLNDRKGADDLAEEARGPRTWVVLLVSLGVLGLIVGAGVAVNRFIGSDSNNAAESGPDTTIDETIDVEPVDDPSATRLFARTTEGGVDIRVHRSEDDAFGFGQFGAGDDIPLRCQVAATVMSTMVSDDSVAQTQVPITKEAGAKPTATLATGGFIEASPIVGVVSQVADDVTMVRLTLGGIASDSMEPINGIIALAVEPPPPPPGAEDDNLGNAGFNQFPFGVDLRTISVEYLHADGSSDRLGEREITQGMGIWNDPACAVAFNGEQPPTEVSLPPITLPRPGKIQPDDPAAATAEIESVFSALYRNVESDDALFRYLDDPSGLDFLMDDVLKSEVGDGYKAMTAEVTDVIFFSPIEANFMYTLTLDPFVNDDVVDMDWYRQYGRARLVNGVWLITRTTICQDIAKSGITCTV
jgi:hypothetical protein